jgi:predicted SAM-dependent methyltransferase
MIVNISRNGWVNTLRLNIGCGNVPLKGWINVDKFYYPGSDAKQLDQMGVEKWENTVESQWLYGDATQLDFPDETFDEVMIIHCLEHLDMEQGNLAIKEAYRVLKPGGTFDVELPDLLKACELMPTVHVTATGDNQPWHRVMGLLYGAVGEEHGGKGQYHLCGYTKEYLRFKLDERGFNDIKELPVGYGHGDAEHGHGEPQFDFRMQGTR